MIGAAGATRLFTVTDFLDTDYVELLRGAEGAEALAGDGRAARHRARPVASRGRSSSAGATRSTAPSRWRAARRCSRTTCATSSSPRAPPAARRARCSCTRRASAPTTRGRRSSGCAKGDRYLIVNPFFHAFGLKAGILACLVKGATIIPHAVFDVPSVMRRVVEERISMLPGPPAIFQTILNHPDLADFDLSSLRLSVTGAAAIPTQMIIDMREKLGFENVVTGYGLTEAHGIATMCRHDDAPEVIAKTSGRAIPDVEVIVADARRRRAADGEQGEVLVRGYNLMKGYLDDPDATAEADRRRRLAAHRRHRVQGRRRQPRDHRPHEGHVHRRRLQRLSRRDREHPHGPRPTSRRSRSSACPTRGSVRSAWRSSCRPPARRSTPTS